MAAFILFVTETVIEQIASQKGHVIKRIDDDEDDKNIFDISDEFDDDEDFHSLPSSNSAHRSDMRAAQVRNKGVQQPTNSTPTSSEPYNPFSDSISSPNGAEINRSFPPISKQLVTKTDSVSSRSDSGYGDGGGRSQLGDTVTPPVRQGQAEVSASYSGETAKNSPHRKKKGDMKKCVVFVFDYALPILTCLRILTHMYMYILIS